jgi:hypothetical protein
MKYSTWNRRETPRVFRLPSWQIALLLLVALALGIAIAIVATGIFLIALPIVVVAVVAYRLFGGRRRQPHRGQVIEGDYEVVEGARSRPSRDGRR